jgi:hypothetical protein
MQMRVRARGVINAHQYQHGIERHGRERVRGHAVHFAIEIDRNDRHARGEAAHGSPKVDCI